MPKFHHILGIYLMNLISDIVKNGILLTFWLTLKVVIIIIFIIIIIITLQPLYNKEN